MRPADRREAELGGDVGQCVRMRCGNGKEEVGVAVAVEAGFGVVLHPAEHVRHSQQSAAKLHHANQLMGRVDQRVALLLLLRALHTWLGP